jgi:hypothetical protein
MAYQQLPFTWVTYNPHVVPLSQSDSAWLLL